MKRINLFLFFIIATIGTVMGQPYHASAMRHLSGNVKECIVKSQNPILKEYSKSKFTKDGKLKTVIMSYNSKGLPYGWNSSVAGMFNNFRIEWDNSDFPSEITLSAEYPKQKYDLKISYEYADSRSVPSGAVYTQRRQLKGNKEESVTFSCRYSNYKYDSHGNWISRDVEQTMISDTSGSPFVETYTETRKIKYY